MRPSPIQLQIGPTVPALDLLHSSSSHLQRRPASLQTLSGARLQASLQAQARPLTPRTLGGAGGTVRAASSTDAATAQQSKLSKFLDATPQKGQNPRTPTIHDKPEFPTPVASQPTEPDPQAPRQSSSALQMVEANFQSVMEQQIQKLTTILSGVVEQRVADVSGQLKQAEQRWAGTVDRERQERRNELSIALQQLESMKQKELDDTTKEIVMKNLDSRFDSLREQVDRALADICDYREELTTTIRSTTAELCGSLTQQQQQHQEFLDLRHQWQEDISQQKSALTVEQQASINSVQQQVNDLRQVMDRCILLKHLPYNAQQPEMTPQVLTPQACDNTSEVSQGLREMQAELRRVEKQVHCHLEDVKLCKRLLEGNREASEVEVAELRKALQTQQRALDSLLSLPRSAHLSPEGSLACTPSQTAASEKVCSRVAELALILGEQEERCSLELADLRSFTTREVSNVRKQIQALSGEMNTVQTTVVRRVGEVCSQTLQDWKDGSGNDLSRFEERLLAVQAVTSKHSESLQNRTAQLSHELKAEREDRCKSAAELHVHCMQLNAAAADVANNVKLQSGKLAVCVRTVDHLQLKCQCLPDLAELASSASNASTSR